MIKYTKPRECEPQIDYRIKMASSKDPDVFDSLKYAFLHERVSERLALLSEAFGILGDVRAVDLLNKAMEVFINDRNLLAAISKMWTPA